MDDNFFALSRLVNDACMQHLPDPRTHAIYNVICSARVLGGQHYLLVFRGRNLFESVLVMVQIDRVNAKIKVI